MKKVLMIIISVFMISVMLFPVSVFAEGNNADKNLLVDEANIIPDEEEGKLLSSLKDFSEKYQMDIVVVTAENIGNSTYEAYADDYFDYNGYGQGSSSDGILLLISMQPRGVAISTSGKCMNYFSNEDCDEIIDDIILYLKSGDYGSAAIRFADEVGAGMKSIKARPVYLIFIALLIGFIAASIIVSAMKAKLNTVAMKQNAAGYQVPGSFHLMQNEDRFLYNNITRTKIERNNSGSSGSHTSSSGHSHGGSSRSF